VHPKDGGHVSAETSRRLACDATRVVMRHDTDGHVTEVGARTRTIPPALRRALHHRDPGCRFPGCGLPFGQGHHIKHWANGGRAVHEERFQVERLPNGALQFTRPDGRILPDVPPPPAVPQDPPAGIKADKRAKREPAPYTRRAHTA
jgi:hypothetical protein